MRTAKPRRPRRSANLAPRKFTAPGRAYQTRFTLLAAACVIAVVDAAQAASAIEEVTVTARRKSEALSEVPLSITAFDQASLAATQTFNVEQTEVQGVQFELALAPSARSALSLSGAWIDAEYTDFDLPDGTASYDGFRAQYAPEWSLVARYHHDFDVAGGRLRAALSTRYESSFWADFSHTPGGRQQAARKSNAQLTWYPAGEGWSVGLWVRNIENEAVIAATAGGSNLPPNPDGATASLEAPRTWGARFTLDF